MVRKLIVLAILIGCSFFACEVQASATPISKATVKENVVKHSLEMGIDPALALSIAKLESDFCHEKKSSYGAVGVFQLLPSTARRMGYNPYYLNENIKCGLKYYQMMYKQFGSIELALAAYNAGPGNIAKYKGMPPFKETKRFVDSIMLEYKNQKAHPDPIITKVKNSNNKVQAKSTQKAVTEKTTVENVSNTQIEKIAIETLSETTEQEFISMDEVTIE